MSLSLEIRGLSRLQHQINALRLSPHARMQVNRAMGRRVATYSKQRITQQQTLSGTAFTPRKARGKGKMLKGLKSRMKVLTSTDSSRVTWSGGKVAWKHQHGWTETMTARKLAERERKHNPSEEASSGNMASRSQAKALLKLGYKIPRNRAKRGSNRPSQGWIMTNLTKDQAGKLIRLLGFLHDNGFGSSWNINLPARTFLGATDDQEAKLLEYLNEQVLGRLNRR